MSGFFPFTAYSNSNSAPSCNTNVLSKYGLDTDDGLQEIGSSSTTFILNVALISLPSTIPLHSITAVPNSFVAIVALIPT